MSPSQKWLGVGCAVAVLCIWSSFILIARSSAKHTLTPFDIAFVRFLFSGLAVLPLLLFLRDKKEPQAQAAATREDRVEVHYE